MYFRRNTNESAARREKKCCEEIRARGAEKSMKNSTSINVRRINSRTHHELMAHGWGLADGAGGRTNRLEATVYFTFI